MGMSTPDHKSPESLPAEPASEPAAADAAPRSPRPREIGGPAGPEPTRFGDWEKNGRCIDF
jgi:hypothetical protein